MKKLVLTISLALMLCFATAVPAVINIDLQNPTFEILGADSFKVGNVIVQGLNGKYWANLKWDPMNLILYPLSYGKEMCLDDDLQNGIYMSCNYFPLVAGNTWVYNFGGFVKTVTISSGTHSFSRGKGKRVNYFSDPCVSQDVFMDHAQNGLEIYGAFDREENAYIEFPTSGPFVWMPKEMHIGDSWTVTWANTSSITVQFVGLETVNVPAGNFSALKIQANVSDMNKGNYITLLWYAKNVGLIKAQRTFESPQGYQGCIYVTPQYPLMELENATVGVVNYP